MTFAVCSALTRVNFIDATRVRVLHLKQSYLSAFIFLILNNGEFLGFPYRVF